MEKREGVEVGSAKKEEGMIALDTVMGVPLHGSCEVKSLPWF